VGTAVQIMLKGALNAVTPALAIEYAEDDIRVVKDCTWLGARTQANG